MTKPMIRIHDTSTNEIIDREMTDDEFATHEALAAQAIANQAEAEANAEAKAAVLTKLGLTAEEVAALLS
jgi:hypothetical protein